MHAGGGFIYHDCACRTTIEAWCTASAIIKSQVIEIVSIYLPLKSAIVQYDDEQ